MAKRRTSKAARAAGAGKLGDFAEDLGRFLGTTQARAQSWLKQREAIAEQLVSVRDTATRLLGELGDAAGAARGRRGRTRAAKLLKTAGDAARRGTKRARSFTAAQRKAQSRRMKAYWTRVRKAKKG